MAGRFLPTAPLSSHFHRPLAICTGAAASSSAAPNRITPPRRLLAAPNAKCDLRRHEYRRPPSAASVSFALHTAKYQFGALLNPASSANRDFHASHCLKQKKFRVFARTLDIISSQASKYGSNISGVCPFCPSLDFVQIAYPPSCHLSPGPPVRRTVVWL